jgi:hypothetical protein
MDHLDGPRNGRIIGFGFGLDTSISPTARQEADISGWDDRNGNPGAETTIGLTSLQL